MKKLFFLAVAAFLATMSANAQQMFLKPMVGGTLATFSGSDAEDTKMKLGLVAGAEFGYKIAEPFAITAGALVSMQGSGQKDTEYTKDVKTTLTYLNIPILANYEVLPGLCLKAGLQPGFLLSAKLKGEQYSGNGWDEFDTDNYKDHCKSFDLSIPMGLSYEISDFVIDARYNLGLTKIGKSEGSHDAANVKNSVIMLTLGYKIPF